MRRSMTKSYYKLNSFNMQMIHSRFKAFIVSFNVTVFEKKKKAYFKQKSDNDAT